ncbi:VanW family protein [Candidatus Gottesmanbacteria bacterium]|nr:VanW family protein [Candidatus Gottesmanbacteria bacterium]
MVKEKKSPLAKKINFFSIIYFFVGIFTASLLLIIILIYQHEKNYSDKIYPGIRVDGVSFGGKNQEYIEKYFANKSLIFSGLKLIFNFEDKIATVSGQDLEISYDGKLSAAQAYSIGRSGHFISDTYQKWRAATTGINLPSVLKMDNDLLDETIKNLSQSIDDPEQDALFQFEKGKVTLFRLSKSGRAVDKTAAKQVAYSYINSLTANDSSGPKEFTINLPITEITPKIKTEDSNTFGIKELIGSGSSKFHGSIPGRIHNVDLAASRINGHLIPPGESFSFNDTLGDISAATGFQPAYIIKEGRTVLGDGGGVCQVSTTLFRAVLNTGLPIVERHAHAYRVHYYEEESPVGIDATVFAPSYDLKFKNDTSNYILIQAKTDLNSLSLVFDLYGTRDDRKVTMTKPVILSQSPPPSDLYQDDPTLPVGVVKQVDWSAWGAKTTFDYKVEKNGVITTKDTFFSNFQPWQAVYLRGTKV